MADLPVRVRYAEGQRVRARDLRAEQQYLVALERRHNLEQHAAGVVSGLHAKGETVHPGAAIDESGHLLVSGEEVDAAPAQNKCVDAWLIFRETPMRARHPGHAACGPGESDRTHELAEVILQDVDANAEAVAPAAGAVYLGRSGCDQDERPPACTALIAATVQDPAGRAVMQVGPASVRDRDQFVVSTAGADGTLVPRIALDRNGGNRFTGTVVLEDYRYCDSVETLDDETVVLRATDPGTAGARLHYRVEPKVEKGEELLNFHFFVGTQPLPLVTLRANIDPLIQFGQLSQAFQASVSLFEAPVMMALSDAGAAQGTGPRQKRQAFAQLASFTPCGGNLIIEEWNKPKEVAPLPRRGCHAEVDIESDAATSPFVGVAFQPATAAPAPATMPAAYSIRTGEATAPVEELRLNLGEAKDNDPAVRLSIGAHDVAADPFRAWLQVTGMCGVILPDPIDNTAAPITMNVTGVITRGAIGADLSDPNFTLLLRLAWLAGLQQSVQSTTQVKLTFKNVAPHGFIETRDAWSYDVEVQNLGPLPITVTGGVEKLTIDGTASTDPIPAGINVPPTADLHVQHVAGVTPAGEMGIEVTFFGNRGTVPWWKVETHTPKIAVLESPTIELPDLPLSLVQNEQWNQEIVVANNDAARDMTLISISAGAIADPNLPAGNEHSDTVPLQAGAPDEFKFTVTLIYQWKDTTVLRTLTREVIIPVTAGESEDAPPAPRRSTRARRAKKETRKK